MIYLASPYSHDDPRIRYARFKAVSAAGSKLMEAGYIFYGPISMTHPLVQYGGVGGTWEFWEVFDRAYLELCSELWVLELSGCRESKGVRAELEIMEELGKPFRMIPLAMVDIIDVTKDTLKYWLTPTELKLIEEWQNAIREQN
jgi:hypothetical protein